MEEDIKPSQRIWRDKNKAAIREKTALAPLAAEMVGEMRWKEAEAKAKLPDNVIVVQFSGPFRRRRTRQ